MVIPTYPGVYVREVPSGTRSIAGVSTSVGAFVDYFAKGPLDVAVQVLSYSDFERTFGGLDTLSEASYAVQQFFRNGGSNAWIVRAASGSPAPATVTIDGAGGAALAVTASTRQARNRGRTAPGEWGNLLRVRVDWDTSNPAALFNLHVDEYTLDRDGNEQLGRSESWLNLSMSAAETRFVETVINDHTAGSDLIELTASGSDLPQLTGTLSGDLSAYAGLASGTPEVEVTIDGTTATATFDTSIATTTLSGARRALEKAIRAAAPSNARFASATVSVVAGNRLRVVAGGGAPDAIVQIAATGGDATTAVELLLVAASADENVTQYVLGQGAVAGSFQSGGSAGANGTPPDGADLIGDRGTKTGLYALEDADLFNLLCIPRTASVDASDANALTDVEAQAVISAAETYCVERRAFLLVDTPNNITEPTDVREWLDDTIRTANAALFYPRLRIPDPLDELRLRSVGASGTIAGLHARIDGSRGVWKAAAGTEATLRNVQGLDYPLTDNENGVLNPLAINCVRNFSGIGIVSWGARTLDGADVRASEWKYIPVRRLALYLEESLYRGIQWAVFEPNDEPLWAQLRLNVGTFMQDLFRQGAFEGATPKEAYFVKCDSETTTASDRDRGIVNVWVGFAPLKPAEFVVLHLQQKTAESA